MRLPRRRRIQEDQPDPAAPGAGAGSAQLAIPDYEQLDPKSIAARLPNLSQSELAAVESHERSHRNRPAVLDKLRYMRDSEPLPGYDELDEEQIAAELADAEAETVKRVRDYERKFKRRRAVLDEAARVLPAAAPSARESLAQEERFARVRAGFADRRKAVDDAAEDRRTSPEDQ